MATTGTARLQESFQDQERVVSINWIDFKDTQHFARAEADGCQVSQAVSDTKGKVTEVV